MKKKVLEIILSRGMFRCEFISKIFLLKYGRILMKKLNIVLILFFVFINVSFTLSNSKIQESCIYTFNFQKGTETYIFGEKVNVRKTDSINSKVITVLPIATKIKILERSEKYYVNNGYKEYWYLIEYGQAMTGYVWGGMLSLNYYRDGEYIFLTAVNSFSIKNGLGGETRLVKNGKLLSTVIFKPHYFDLTDPPVYGYRVFSKLYSNGKKLKNVDSVYEIGFQYEACGYPNGSVYIARIKNKLVKLLKITSVAEAGVFHYDEEIIFPDGAAGKEDRIIVIKTEAEFDVKRSDYKVVKESKEIYFWNGMYLKKL